MFQPLVCHFRFAKAKQGEALQASQVTHPLVARSRATKVEADEACELPDVLQPLVRERVLGNVEDGEVLEAGKLLQLRLVHPGLVQVDPECARWCRQLT